MKKLNINKLRGKPINVVYHKNCLDGLMSAAIMKEILTFDERPDAKFIACQYGEELKIDENSVVIFVDFSLKQSAMEELCNKSYEVYVYDHHKSALAELNDMKDIKNFYFTYEPNVCGTQIVYDHVYFGNYNLGINPTIASFLTDMDLFKFRFEETFGLRAYLEYDTQKKDIDKAIKYLYMSDSEIKNISEKGSLINDFIWRGAEKISKSVEKSKMEPIKVVGHEFIAINCTDRISEVGNQICKDHKKLALLYFLNNENKVVCSLRGNENLPDASIIASFFGGGGHRDACGFQIPLEQLQNFLNNGFKEVIKFRFTGITIVSHNEVIKIGEDPDGNDIITGSVRCEEKEVNGYYYMSKSGRPLMFSYNINSANKTVHYKNNELSNIKINFNERVEL